MPDTQPQHWHICQVSVFTRETHILCLSWNLGGHERKISWTVTPPNKIRRRKKNVVILVQWCNAVLMHCGASFPGSCVLGRRGNHAGEQCSKVTSIVCCVSDVMRMTSKVFRSRAESGVLELWCLKDWKVWSQVTLIPRGFTSPYCRFP